MTPRQIWFKNRINEIIMHLHHANKIKNWEDFRETAHELACELLYATTEWDKYYRDINGKAKI